MKLATEVDSIFKSQFNVADDYIYWFLCFRSDIYLGSDSSLLCLADM